MKGAPDLTSEQMLPYQAIDLIVNRTPEVSFAMSTMCFTSIADELRSQIPCLG